jgi:hypothetical protein
MEEKEACQSKFLNVPGIEKGSDDIGEVYVNRLRCREPVGNSHQSITIHHLGVVEPRKFDKNDISTTTVRMSTADGLNLCTGQRQITADNCSTLSYSQIDELVEGKFEAAAKRGVLTELFPAPGGPRTLE